MSAKNTYHNVQNKPRRYFFALNIIFRIFYEHDRDCTFHHIFSISCQGIYTISANIENKKLINLQYSQVSREFI